MGKNIWDRTNLQDLPNRQKEKMLKKLNLIALKRAISKFEQTLDDRSRELFTALFREPVPVRIEVLEAGQFRGFVPLYQNECDEVREEFVRRFNNH